MNAETAHRIETGVDGGAAALLAAATAVLLLRFDASSAYSATGAALAFGWAFHGLRSIEREARGFAIPLFEAVPLEIEELPELLLTEVHCSNQDPAHPANELVLDDILVELGPNSRVVRLFDPAAMPTPGQLKARIDRHLHEANPEAASSDASRELYQALAELRRSLR